MGSESIFADFAVGSAALWDEVWGTKTATSVEAVVVPDITSADVPGLDAHYDTIQAGAETKVKEDAAAVGAGLAKAADFGASLAKWIVVGLVAVAVIYVLPKVLVLIPKKG